MPISWEAHQEPIAGYRLIERIGSGGFGEVWKAEAPGGLLKAIKFVYGSVTSIDSDNRHAVQELKALERVRRVRHPFILSMERYDIINGQLVIVMELADRNLHDRMRECNALGMPGIPRPELLRYLGEAAEALDMMNAEHDLQHLDIKPQNLFLTGNHVKVADFGLVKDLEGFTAQVTGGVTPIYAPPETFDGWVSRHSDQYSLAIVFQEMLTGRRPFNGPSARQYMVQHLTLEPDLTGLAERDQPIARRALAKDANERFGSCSEFIEALRDASPPGRAGSREPTLGSSTDASSAARSRETGVPAAQPPTRTEAPLEEWVGVRQSSLSTKCEPAYKSRPEATTSVRSAVRYERSPPVSLPNGIHVPTLVVGIGRTGIRCLERVRQRFHACFPGAFPPVRLVGVDLDPRVLQDIAKSESLGKESFDQTLICRLQKPNHYLQNWENLKQLAAWLDPNYILQMDVSGGSNGHRPLGRLAFFENYRRVLSRMRTELQTLLNLCTQTGIDLRRQQPRVWVIANMGGGTGAGMFVDVCYLLREVLAGQSDQPIDIHGLLVGGVNPAERHPELRKINHYALCQDLLQLSQQDADFQALYEVGGESHRHNTPPTKSLTFFDISAEHIAEPREVVVLDSLAEMIFQHATGPLGQQLDRYEEKGVWPPFRGMGWFSLLFPQRALARQVAGRLCQAIVARWRQSLDRHAGERVSNRARQNSCLAPLMPHEIRNELLDGAQAHLGQPIEKLVNDCIAKLRPARVGQGTPSEAFGADYTCETPAGADQDTDSTGAAPSEISLRVAVLQELQQLLGGDGDDQNNDQVPRVPEALRAASDFLVQNHLVVLVASIAEQLDRPGPKLDAARHHWEGISRQLLQIVDDLQPEVDLARQRLSVVAGGLRRRLDGTLPGLHLHSLAESLQMYAREKVAFLLMERTQQTLLALRGKFSDRSGDFVVLRQQFERMEDSLVAYGQEQDDFGAPCASERLFPGGLVSVTEAANAWMARFSEEQLAFLQEVLQALVFAPEGGLWAACTQFKVKESILSQRMIEETMIWVMQNMTATDVAECFWDRHRTDPSGMAREIRSFHDWATPSVCGREGLASLASTDGLHETFLLSVPGTPEGDKFRQALVETVPQCKPVVFNDHHLAVFCRIIAHNNPGKLLPSWLLKSRRAYEAACQGRFSPILFPIATPGNQSK